MSADDLPARPWLEAHVLARKHVVDGEARVVLHDTRRGGIVQPLEATRVRALLPLVLEGGARYERVFKPERGPEPTGGAAVTLCDGRCAYLGDTGRCGLLEAGGAAAIS
jgi:hypothetical protein